LRNRNLTVDGHRTSVRLEPVMWSALDEICRRERKGLNRLAGEIAQTRRESTLTAAIRVFILGYFRAAATEQGHRLAGHGAWRSQPRADALGRHLSQVPGVL
jgi:predicted DNA-binding ribbon-helix-helix protein